MLRIVILLFCTMVHGMVGTRPIFLERGTVDAYEQRSKLLEDEALGWFRLESQERRDARWALLEGDGAQLIVATDGRALHLSNVVAHVMVLCQKRRFPSHKRDGFRRIGLHDAIDKCARWNGAGHLNDDVVGEDDIAKHFLKREQKIDFKPQQQFEAFQEGTPEQLGKLLDYCFMDVKVTFLLEFSLNIIAATIVTASVAWITANMCSTRGQQILNYCVSHKFRLCLVRSSGGHDNLVRFRSFMNELRPPWT